MPSSSLVQALSDLISRFNILPVSGPIGIRPRRGRLPITRVPYQRLRLVCKSAGIGVSIVSAVFTVREAGSLVSIGTLLAFVIVSIGVLVLRIREPELPRTFKTPVVWVVAPLGALSALYLMWFLPWRTWERLIIWFIIGMIVYFFYGVRRSKLAKPRENATPT